MNVAIENLTPAEAAVVAGVSMRDVHRVIDEHILPECLYAVGGARSFRSDACVFIAFYFEAANRLTSEERQRAIALASRHSPGEKSTKVVRDGFLTIDFAPFWTNVDKRLQLLNAARDQVSTDDGILGGIPVISGTRVPVYDVAASVAAGFPIDRILSAYPSLNRDQVELAAVFAEANPQRGRPKQPGPPSVMKVISSRRKPRSVAR
jgi:uncharacterized protein (DUF433 family)